MQMTPMINCIHRKPLDMAWFGALAAVALIIFLPRCAFLKRPIHRGQATHSQILVYYIPERKGRFDVCVIWHSADTDDEWTSMLLDDWRGQLVAGQRTYMASRSRGTASNKNGPELRGHFCDLMLLRSTAARPASASSDAVARNVAGSDCHVGVGQQQPVDGREQAAEQAGRGRMKRGGSGIGHWFLFLSQKRRSRSPRLRLTLI